MHRAAASSAMAILFATSAALADDVPVAVEPPIEQVPIEVPAQPGVPAPAPIVAQPAAPVRFDDVIALNAGGAINGHITEVRLGQFAIITLPSGEIRIIPWNAIAYASTEVTTLTPASSAPPSLNGAGLAGPWSGGAVATIAPQAAPAFQPQWPVRALPVGYAPGPSPTRDFLTPGPGRVAVTVTGDHRGQYVGVANGDVRDATGRRARRAQPTAMCQAPCTLYVPPGPFALYVGGSGVQPSVHRAVAGLGGTQLRIVPPSTRMRTLGTLMIPLGALLAVGGVYYSSLYPSAMSSSAGFDPGATAVLAGLASVIAGFVIRGGTHTRIETTRAPLPASQFYMGAAPTLGGGMAVGGLSY